MEFGPCKLMVKSLEGSDVVVERKCKGCNDVQARKSLDLHFVLLTDLGKLRLWICIAAFVYD